MSFRVIGISGSAKAGKSTTAQHLADHHGFHKTAFASLLRKTAILLYPWLEWMKDPVLYEMHKGDIDPKLGITIRKLLQLLGTEVGRWLWSDTWVDAVRREIENEKRLARYQGLVVDDVRFPNEVAMIVGEWGGELWAIQRPGLSAPVGGVKDHVSEAHAEEFQTLANHVIVNDGSFEDLYEAVDDVLD